EKHLESAPDLRGPEQLFEYVKTINPGMWVLLIGCAVLLNVFICFSAGRTLMDGIPCGCICDDGLVKVYLGCDNLGEIKKGMQVIIEGDTYYVTDIAETRGDELGDYYYYVMDTAEIEYGEPIYCFSVRADIEEGPHFGLIVTNHDNAGDFFMGGAFDGRK
ncbi:MAG: hypothetical protein IKR68_03255, partial [Lachnospiraceae bacterium]|nr:hypothetical protein [Lachnospiraceae bacterium]